MSVYKMNADYNPEGSVLKNAEADFPARIQVATSDSFSELRLSRDGFESVMEVVSNVVENDVPSEAEIDGPDDTFRIDAARPDVEDSWNVSIVQQDLRSEFMLTQNELEGFDRLLRSVHPDHEVDPDEDPNLELHA